MEPMARVQRQDASSSIKRLGHIYRDTR